MEIKKIMSQMSITEKASLCSGKDFWTTKPLDKHGIISIMMTDGPHGLRKQKGETDHMGLNQSIKATCFPTYATVACSWDKELVFRMGQAIARECIRHNVSIILGPGTNIKRSPLCGRNFEYFSEDPYIAGHLSAAFINGVQSMGIGTSLKHFAVNNQEKRRMTIDVHVDPRTLHEIYLRPFEIAVKNSLPYTVMCAYNKVNGLYCSEDKYLLNDVLREKWGYEGVVITDWGAVGDRVIGLESGLDIEMPASNGQNDQKIVDAIENGKLDIQPLDKAVERILGMYSKLKRSNTNVTWNYNDHHKLAKEIALESIVLLKNVDNILPLSNDKEICIIGEFAEHPRYQGSGSSKINPFMLKNALQALEGKNISYAKGYNQRDTDPDAKLIEESISLARNCDVAVIFAGLTDIYESEGFDREHMHMPPAHNILIEEVAKANKNTVVILSGGSPVEMPWADKVKGIVNTYLGGEGGAEALVDILYGNANPCGKLAETYPISLKDTPSYCYFNDDDKIAKYKEGIYIGYRYYDSADVKVLYPFGFGLSYTTFQYKNFIMSNKLITPDQGIIAKITIKNTGSVDGAEIVQLYQGCKDSSVFRPSKELIGFEKIYLKSGEEKSISFTINSKDFSYYNIEENRWYTENGKYNIMVGSCSRDIKITQEVLLKSHPSQRTMDYSKNSSIYDDPKKVKKAVKDEEFYGLFKDSNTLQSRDNDNICTMNTTIEDVLDTDTGRKLYEGQYNKLSEFTKGLRKNDPMVKMSKTIILEMPIRSIIMFSSGQITYNDVNDIVKKINQERVQERD